MKRILYILIVGLSFSGCSDFLNVEPKNSVTYDNYFKTEKEINTAVQSMHAVFRSAFGSVSARLNRQRALPFDFLANIWDNMRQNNFKDTWYKGSVVLYWDSEYRTIAMANLVIDNIDRAELAEDRYNFYLGQAYVIRAYSYYRIIQLWGDAPIVKGLEDTETKSREPWVKVCDYIVNDLKEAIKMLPPASELKDIDGNLITDKQVPSKWTAYAILAYVQAWQAQLNNQPELLPQALAACNEVINSGDYQLAGNIEEVCNTVMDGDSHEGIFELHFSTQAGEENTKGNCLAGVAQRYPVEPLSTPATSRPNMAIKFTTVFDMYSETDERRNYFYDLETTSNLPVSQTRGYAYLNKFRSFVTHQSGILKGRLRAYTVNEILIRLSGMYLLRAELRAKTGDQAGAIADLNVVRKRANAPEYAANEGDLRKVISLERQKELFGEGDNFLELLREGFAEEVPGFKNLTAEDIKEGRAFIPLSSKAFENNTKQTQYPYWERQGY